MTNHSTYKMPIPDAVGWANKILDVPAGRGPLLHTTLCVRDIASAAYAIGYKAAQADAITDAQQSQRSPFAMQEIAPGMFAMTLENPEQLFTLLDALFGERDFI